MLDQSYLNLIENNQIYEPRTTPLVFVGISGGKDSTALAIGLPDSYPVFTDTGWEFPEMYAHIDKFEQVTGRHVTRIKPKETLPEYIKRSKFLPGHGARFCTRMFKIDTMNKWMKRFTEYYTVILAIGLRADEKEDDRVGNLTEMSNLIIKYPFRDAGIKREGVIRLCLKYNLLPQYPAYMMRGGCVGCFYKRKSEVKAMAQLCPKVLDELQELEELVQDERGKFAYMFPNTGMSIRNIRAQPALFDMRELYADALKTDDYGRACGLFCNR